MDSTYPDSIDPELKRLLRFLGQIFLPFFYGFLTKVRTSLAPRNCCPNTELLPGVGAIDTDLDPEINVNYELGARLRYGALNVEAIGFYSHYSDTGCSGNRRCLYYNEKNL